MLRRLALIAAVGFVGCESLKHTPEPVAMPPTAGTQSNSTPPPPPLVATPAEIVPVAASEPETLPVDSLTLAAECLSRGEHTSAATHLEAHVRTHPEQLMFRLQLADLLVRLGRDAPAKIHYERFAAETRRTTGPLKKQLVRVHTSLMEIGQRSEDRFTEVYHRGVGLLLLVKEQEASGERDDGFAEEMLCKALAALTEAKKLKPTEMQVRLDLAEAYEKIGNRRAAELEREVARTAIIPNGLPPTLPE